MKIKNLTQFIFPTVDRPLSTIDRYDSTTASQVPMTARHNSTADRPNSMTASINSTNDRYDLTADKPNSTSDSINSMTYSINSTTATCNSDTYSINSTIDRCYFGSYSAISTKNRRKKEPTLRSTAHLQFAQALPQAQKLQKSMAALPQKNLPKKLFLIWNSNISL